MKNLTQTEYEFELLQHAELIQRCDQYRALCIANQLPQTLDISLLAVSLQAQIFDKLLAVDKGLKARYDVLRSDTARLQLIATTVNLDGYDVVDELTEMGNTIRTLYDEIFLGTAKLNTSVSIENFDAVRGLDLAKLLQSYVIDWTGKEDVLTYFKSVPALLAQITAVAQAADACEHGRTCSESTFYALKAVLWCFDQVGNTLIVNEHKAWRVASTLQRNNRLDIVK
jgi:hypothetical protein